VPRECNFNHVCEGRIFKEVEGGWVCQKAIADEGLLKCRICKRYGRPSVVDYHEDSGEYECKLDFGCKDRREEILVREAEEYYNSLR
jgi:hypothetical protein